MLQVPSSGTFGTKSIAFGFARDMFVVPQLLPAPVLEKIILEAFYRFYDNATNGNRTRGGMKNAFQTYCP